MTEDAPTLLDEVREASRRKVSCSVCDWIEARADAAEWDAVMVLPWQEANSRAIHAAMANRGYTKGDKPVADHRAKGHRVG